MYAQEWGFYLCLVSLGIPETSQNRPGELTNELGVLVQNEVETMEMTEQSMTVEVPAEKAQTCMHACHSCVATCIRNICVFHIAQLSCLHNVGL